MSDEFQPLNGKEKVALELMQMIAERDQRESVKADPVRYYILLYHACLEVVANADRNSALRIAGQLENGELVGATGEGSDRW